MSAEFLTLGYTILAGLLGLTFYLGRVSSRVDQLASESKSMTATIGTIFAKLDQISIAVAKAQARDERRHPEA